MRTDVTDLPRVEVFIAGLSLLDVANAEAAFVSQLTPEEQGRLRSKTPKRRREYLVGRVLARAALANWSGVAAAAWGIAVAERGRPFAVTTGDVAVPSLNWSHSRDIVVCGLAEAADIGVDVEHMRPRDLQGIAEKVCSPAECEYLERQTEAKKLETFYRLWTLKEACAKALGTGMETPFRELVFAWDDSGRHIQFRSTLPVLVGKTARFLTFMPAPGMMASVALLSPAPGRPGAIRFHAMTGVDTFTQTDVIRVAGTADDVVAGRILL